MTKKERRKQQLERHYRALEAVAKLCGVENPDGKKLSCKLLRLEQQAHRLTTDYCNGVIQSDEWEEVKQPIYDAVNKLFNGELYAFFVNTDARGCALKIRDDAMSMFYKDTGLFQDWGGYGLLAPTITGE